MYSNTLLKLLATTLAYLQPVLQVLGHSAGDRLGSALGVAAGPRVSSCSGGEGCNTEWSGVSGRQGDLTAACKHSLLQHAVSAFAAHHVYGQLQMQQQRL